MPLAGSNDESWCQGLDGLASRSAAYYQQGARFAKWYEIHNKILVSTPKKILGMNLIFRRNFDLGPNTGPLHLTGKKIEFGFRSMDFICGGHVIWA